MDGGSVVFTLAADADFLASGATVQPFAQGIDDGGMANWGCWINNSDLSEEPTEYTCDGFSDFVLEEGETAKFGLQGKEGATTGSDRKSTRLNSSHVAISYAVF